MQSLSTTVAASSTAALPNRPQPRFYRPELDVLRFFAFICVFVHHSMNLQDLAPALLNTTFGNIFQSVVTSLNTAVSLFFFLSSYLITGLLDAELQSTGKLHIRAFYVRRILRIWPLYYAFFGFCVLVGLAVPHYHVTRDALLAFLFFAANWHFVVHGWAAASRSYGLLWSVSVEEQFYLVCPFMVKLFKRNGLIVLSVLSILASYAFLFWFGRHGYTEDSPVRPNTLVQMQYFSAGTLTALFMRHRNVVLSWGYRLLLFFSGVIFWIAGRFWFDFPPAAIAHSAWPTVLNYFFVLVGCLCIFFSFLNLREQVLPRSFIDLGKISYGLYVYHAFILYSVHMFCRGLLAKPIFQLIADLIALAVTIAAAKLSYRWLESPFLKLKERFTFVKNRAV
jgi:peptidoglycan/LPS O-acetylase OafA/YrhL